MARGKPEVPAVVQSVLGNVPVAWGRKHRNVGADAHE